MEKEQMRLLRLRRLLQFLNFMGVCLMCCSMVDFWMLFYVSFNRQQHTADQRKTRKMRNIYWCRDHSWRKHTHTRVPYERLQLRFLWTTFVYAGHSWNVWHLLRQIYWCIIVTISSSFTFWVHSIFILWTADWNYNFLVIINQELEMDEHRC